ARWLSVGASIAALRPFRQFTPGAVTVLTWGGLRGGISVALALSLPLGPQREIVLALTYCVVVFSILVQGLSIGWLVRRVVRTPQAP
ncbi:MAG: cation:proton antiporter, partial [Burkholderiaceae bacterium]|nr:cation:proton antiporter [Burkholderiaceae bacterium]